MIQSASRIRLIKILSISGCMLLLVLMLVAISITECSTHMLRTRVVQRVKQESVFQGLLDWTDSNKPLIMDVARAAHSHHEDEWEMDAPFDWRNIGFNGPAIIDVVIDRKTGLPLEVRFCQGSRFYVAVRMDSAGERTSDPSSVLYRNGRVHVVDLEE